MQACAVVTGGTSGIGAAFAEALAQEGYDLLLTGRRREKIVSMAADLRARTGRRVDIEIVELATGEERQRLCATIAARNDVEILVNNAGFGLSAFFGNEEWLQQMDMVDVHIRAPLELIHTVLPQMKSRRAGAIINVGSIASFFPMPGGGMYAASKSFLVSFSESLSMELEEAGIRVQALCPGMTRTDFHEQMGLAGKELMQRKLLLWMSAEEVVQRSLRCLRRNRVVCVPGFFNTMLSRTLPHMPRKLYYRLLRRVRLKGK